MPKRVSIESNRHEGTHPIGFNTKNVPDIYGDVPALTGMTPEEALKALADVTPAGPASPGSEPPTASKRVS